MYENYRRACDIAVKYLLFSLSSRFSLLDVLDLVSRLVLQLHKVRRTSAV